MKAKNPRAKKLGAGVHLVSIASMQYARDYNQVLVENRTGENAMQIRFKDNTGHDISGRFWLSTSSQWILDAFYKAINIDPKQETEVKDILGRRLWICVAEKRITRNQHTSTYYELLPKFFKVIDPTVRPSIVGDPVREKVCSGIFLIEENYDEQQVPHFEETDEIPWKDDDQIKLY